MEAMTRQSRTGSDTGRFIPVEAGNDDAPQTAAQARHDVSWTWTDESPAPGW